MKKKKRFKKIGLNIEAIIRNSENYLLQHPYIAPGMAEDIKSKRAQQTKKRFFRTPFISR